MLNTQHTTSLLNRPLNERQFLSHPFAFSRSLWGQRNGHKSERHESWAQVCFLLSDLGLVTVRPVKFSMLLSKVRWHGGRL